MKKFLVLLVFTLGKEYRVGYRVLCVVVLGFGSSLCSLCCGSSIWVKNSSRTVHITAHVSVSEKSAVHSLMLLYRECSGT